MPRNVRIPTVLAVSLTAIGVPIIQASQPTIPYSGCGNLVPGVECPRFMGDDGVSFSMPGTGGFSLGDYVFVSGSICAECPSICQEGAVFELQRISHCLKDPPTHIFSECGTLEFTVSGPNPSCLVFSADSGGLYLVENLGGFGPGDYVRVTTDQIATPCETLCGEFEACLEDNGIQPCIEKPFVIDVCGTLVFVQGQVPCVVFQDDFGNRWMLSDMGDFQAGDHLHITGLTSPCQPFCSNVSGCIANDPPIGCLGDVDNSGEVGVNDLLAIINGWGACNDCPEDLNHDGQVNVDDLLIVINHWN